MRIVIDYGDHAGYSLEEIPAELLQELSRRYPLDYEKYDPSDGPSLLITIGIHQEVHRRSTGGDRKKRMPTVRELAKQLVTKGFHQLSKQYHPDHNGAAEAQRRLNDVREHLNRACDEISEYDQHAIRIPDPNDSGPNLTDDEIPF